jgi:hypothetical protein
VVTVTRYEGRATIRQGKQDVGVECVFTMRPARDTKGSWYGRFTDGQARLATGEAVLVLPSGESGQIIIDYLNELSGASGTFTGAQGPPSSDR